MEQMSEAYNSEICLNYTIPAILNLWKTNEQNFSDYQLANTCLHGEPDLERLMKRDDLNANQLKWIWNFWHNFVGPQIKYIYPTFVQLQNEAARSNGILIYLLGT